MKTLKPSLVVSAALAGILAAAAPAYADHHEGEKKHEHKGKKEKKHKGKHGKADAAAADKGGDEKVHCMGINACKGKGECGVDGKHGCAGANACKGQGWVSLAKKDCAAKNGAVQGAAADKAMPEKAVAPEKTALPEKAGKPAKKK